MVFNSKKPEIGFFTRTATAGEEYALIVKFIDYYCDKFKRNNRKNRLAILIEPRIDSGFPDVVFASYLPSIAENWSD